jgi:multidrug efflux pump subunit AcrB
MMGMALVVVLLFNAFRQPLIIALILPLSGIGVTAGLLLTGQPFGFMAMLGALSLFGMLIKNAVVLIDQIDLDIRSGTEAYEAIVESSVSRLRPVMMASMTTVLAMIPLVTDRLFGAMAVTIMSGLTFATVLTLVVVPVLYAMFFKVHAPPK